MNPKTLHLALDGSAAGSVRALASGMPDSSVIALREHLAIGPLLDLYTSGGLERRRDWMAAMLTTIRFPEPFDELYRDIGLPVLERLKGDRHNIVVWCGPSADEQLILRVVAASAIDSSILVADVSGVDADGARPRAVGQCSVDALALALSAAQPLQVGDRKRLALEWHAITRREGTLRFYVDGAVVDASEDFFDGDLMGETMLEFDNAAKLVGRVMGRSRHLISDTFLHYRLRKLISAGAILAEHPEQPPYRLRVRRHGGR